MRNLNDFFFLGEIQLTEKLAFPVTLKYIIKKK